MKLIENIRQNNNSFLQLLIPLVFLFLFSCSSFFIQDKINEYQVDYLLPISNDYKNSEYHYKSALDYRPVLTIGDSVAFFDIYTQVINKDGHERIIDTLFPYYSFYCNKLGDGYRCKDCSPFEICDCWNCVDSSREISIFKGRVSEVYLNKAGQFVCTFLDTLISSEVTIELINKTRLKIKKQK